MENCKDIDLHDKPSKILGDFKLNMYQLWTSAIKTFQNLEDVHRNILSALRG